MSQQTNEKETVSSSPKNKDIIISIILTESTTSLLKLDLPHLDDSDGASRPAVCAIRAEENITQTNYSKNSVCRKLSEFTYYWFSNVDQKNGKSNDCEKVSSELAYLRSNPDLADSLASLDITEDQFEDKRCFTIHSQPSSGLKLKPTKVYTRPLFTVRSLAHRNLLKSDGNNIYISVLASHPNITESGWINVCRICHGGESTGDLLSPCDCRGSIALAHLECLEHWLKESANSRCELCQHHFQIIREPRYSVVKSIFVFLRHPGDHLIEILLDLFGFMIYTPTAIVATYILMLLCESIAKYGSTYGKHVSAHIMTFSAVLGMAVIDFTYSTWFMGNLQKHIIAWRTWYRNNCEVKLLLPERSHKRRRMALEDEVD